MKFKPRFEKRQKREQPPAPEIESQESLTVAQEALAFTEQITPYAEEYYIQTDIQEALKEIVTALHAGDTLAAYHTTEILIQDYGGDTCNLNALHDQLRQDLAYTQKKSEHATHHIAQEQETFISKAQALLSDLNPKNLLTTITDTLATITDKAKYATAIAIAITGIGVYTPEVESAPDEEKNVVVVKENRSTQQIEMQIPAEITNLKNANPEVWDNFIKTHQVWINSNTDQVLAIWKTLSDEQKIHILSECENLYFTLEKFRKAAINNLLGIENTKKPGPKNLSPEHIDTVIQIILQNADSNPEKIIRLLTTYSELNFLVDEIAKPQLTHLLQVRIQQGDRGNNEYSVRSDVTEVLKKTKTLTSNEKMFLQQQIDQQYPDPPFEEMLDMYTKTENKGDFFWGDVWREASPETKIQLINTIIENGTISKNVSYKISEVLEDYYYYPAAEKTLQKLIEKYPFTFLRAIQFVENDTLQVLHYKEALLKQWKSLDAYEKFSLLGHITHHYRVGNNRAISKELLEDYVESKNKRKSTRGRGMQKVADKKHANEKIRAAALKNIKRDARGTINVLKREKCNAALKTLTAPQITYLLKTNIQQANYEHDKEYRTRQNTTEIFKKTEVLTDGEKLSLSQQIDQQYPDPPFEEMLDTYTKTKNKGDFFWRDVWREANPETKIKLINTIIENGTVSEDMSYKISEILKDYYFYPEAEEMFDAILKESPQIFFEGIGIYTLSPRHVKKVIENIASDTFQKKAKQIMRLCEKQKSLGVAYFKQEMEKRFSRRI